jgi:hypothetical protein
MPIKKDRDFQKYEIYRSTSKNFIPTLDLRISTSIGTEYQDIGVADGYRYYYQVLCVDANGNRSKSPEVSVFGSPVNRTISLNGNWNMVSAPLDVDDFSKEALFPIAISNAFYYDGAYKVADSLVNGKGYWIKIGPSQDHSIPGYLFDIISIDVGSGWNMIGSISEPILVSNITSDPPGMTTSEYFEFNGIYQKVNIIEPGKGYWVKVEGEGKLILSKVVAKSAAGKINIVQTAELPPMPPEVMVSGRETPGDFILRQNYPNPFNPSTSIRYGLPGDGHVTISAYNTLGQLVAHLVDQKKEAGYHEVKFDASNLPSGIYFVRMNVNVISGQAYNNSIKIILTK